MSANSYEELKAHIGHTIVCVGYGRKEEPCNVAVECETCGEVLMDFDRCPDFHADEKIGVVIEAGDEADADAIKARVEKWIKGLDKGDYKGRKVFVEKFYM